MRNTLGILVVLMLLPLLLGAVKWAARRSQLHPEVRRKLVHLGMGLATLSFPWIFTHVWPVVIVAGLSLVLLTLVKRLEAESPDGECVLYGVGRKSQGDLWFPIAVVIVFWWADGDWVLYVIPILILTVADAMGALIGTGYGRTPFKVLSGSKSLEGCVTFFLTAFLSAHVPLLLGTDTGRAESLAIALILGLVAMLFEAVSTRGIDNLLVPVVSAWLLRQYLGMELEPLGWRIVLMAGLLVFVLISRRYSTLEGGALLGAVLFGYGCWNLGDGRFLLPPLILFVEHLTVSRRLRNFAELKHDLLPVLSVAFSVLPWLVAAQCWPDHKDTFLAAFTIGTAVHLAVLNLSTRLFLARNGVTLARLKKSAAKAAILIGLPGWLLASPDWVGIIGAAVTFVILLGLNALFVAVQGMPKELSAKPGRWIGQGLLALGGGSLALVMLMI